MSHWTVGKSVRYVILSLSLGLSPPLSRLPLVRDSFIIYVYITSFLPRLLIIFISIQDENIEIYHAIRTVNRNINSVTKLNH